MRRAGVLVAALVAIAAPASAVASKRVIIGESREGRPIVAERSGDRGAAQTVLVVGSIHGDETEGHRVTKLLAGRQGRGLSGVELWTIKTVNPDGVAAKTRGNAHRVDLNRNFGYGWESIPPESGYYSGPRPFSEPESRAVRRFVRLVEPEISIWYHQPWGVTLVPCNRSRETALEYARLSGLPPRDCDKGKYPGSVASWQNHAMKAVSFVVELPGQPLSRRQVRRHAEAVIGISVP